MQIIEINKWDWTEREGLSSTGKRVKAWYVRNSDNTTFLFKIPKKYENPTFITSEIWTEIIAYHIGTALGLSIPKIYPAKRQDENGKNEYGVLVENFLEKGESLSEAKDFLKGSKQNPAHNILIIDKFFRILDHNFNLKFWNDYKKMLIYDCLIGNNDRHDENWGLCYKIVENKQGNTFVDLNIRFAPIYDNASCFTRELSEQGVKDILENERKFNKYITGKNSRPPNLFWEENDPKKYTHFQLMEKLIEREQKTRQIINDFLEIDYISPVNDIMKKIQCLDLPEEYKLSDNRTQAIVKILEARKAKMQELL